MFSAVARSRLVREARGRIRPLYRHVKPWTGLNGLDKRVIAYLPAGRVSSSSRREGRSEIPHELTVLERAEWIRDLTDSQSPITFIPRPVDDPSVRQPDITLARRELGWEPEVPLETGLKQTIDWFRGHLDLVQQIAVPAEALVNRPSYPAAGVSCTPADVA